MFRERELLQDRISKSLVQRKRNLTRQNIRIATSIKIFQSELELKKKRNKRHVSRKTKFQIPKPQISEP